MTNKKGFTLIELLVVIAIIGLLSTLAVVALNSARAKSRDSKRVADTKQMQTALELYFADNNGYPPTPSPATLGAEQTRGLSGAGFCGTGTGATACSGTTYMGLVPAAPDPDDCTTNAYTYAQTGSGTGYTIIFCTAGVVGDLTAGSHTADSAGIR